MKFWPLNPYYKRSDWKTLLAERFSEVLTSKLWNKKNTYCWSLSKWSEIELYSPPYCLIKNLWQNHGKDSHVEFTGKNKSRQYHVSKIMWLDWSKMAKQFSVNSRGNFLCQYQASREASTRSGVSLSQSFADTFQPFKLLFWWNILYFLFCANV